MSTATGFRPADLHALLLASHSATAVLQSLCGGPIQACRVSPDAIDDDPAHAELLRTGAGEPVTRRHVRLTHGTLELSQAHLWYVPARLPSALAHTLSTTALPFGQVVRDLGLRRVTLSARIGAASQPHALEPGAVEPHAVEHDALLVGTDGRPVALVHERYGWGLFSPS